MIVLSRSIADDEVFNGIRSPRDRLLLPIERLHSAHYAVRQLHRYVACHGR